MYEAGEFDVATLVFNRFKSVISQIPTAQQLIPAEIPEGRSGAPDRRRVYEYEPDEGEILAETLLPRNLTVQICARLLENAGLRAGRAHVGDGLRHAQCRRDDQEADAADTTARVRR
jgi:F-type H+-transporting ATPase subunit gamma